MQDLRLPSTDLRFVWMKITTVEDPTGKPVTMAVMPRGVEPADGDYKTAAWVPGAPYYCQVLVGAGSAIGELDEGTYRMWAKVVATPEIPRMPSTNCLVIT